MNKARALIGNWLLLDFFGEARRAGRGHASSLTTTIFTQSFLAFVFAALLYPDTPPVPFAAANLCLSTLLIAIGALGDESRPERRAADDHLLRASPLAPMTAAIARAGHAAFAVVLVTVGMALPPAILLAFLTHDPLRGVLYVPGACLCSALATGALGVLARASTRWFGTAGTALLMGSLKAVTLGGGIVLFAIGLSRLQGTSSDMPIGRTAVTLLPPYQVAQWLWQPTAGAWRLLVLAAVGVGLMAIAALVGIADEPARLRARRRSPLDALLQRITPAGPARAIAEFTAIGMWRNAGFRARVLPLLGMPVAMVFLALRDRATANDFVLGCVLAQLPAIYLPFLVMFLPRADQPGTGWVFAQAPRLTTALVRDAAWRALVTHVLVPVFVIATVAALGLGQAGLALLPAVVFAAGLATISARASTAALSVVPFTEARDGERSPDLGSLFATAIGLGGAGAAFALVLPPWLRWPVGAASIALAVWQLRRSRLPAHDHTEEAWLTGDPGETDQTDGRASAAEPALPSPDPTTTAATKVPTLRRELRAVLVLDVILCGLPALVGMVFAA